MNCTVLCAVLIVLVIIIAAVVAPRGRTDGFRPVPENQCGSIMDDHYAVDMSFRNAAGTVVWDPYSTQSRVSLERDAETPEVATPPNPVTGIGYTSAVRRMGDRYRRGDELRSITAYELQPGQPGYMEEVDDNVSSLLSKLARRPANAKPAPACGLATTDVDSEFYTDGYFDDALLGGKSYVRETMTSDRSTVQNTLTASRTGLGSTRRDPRFEPGPQWRTPGGDASWSHGGSAGGPTSGAYGSSLFAPPANWFTTYVAGYGDPNNAYGDYRTAEVVVEEPATWTH